MSPVNSCLTAERKLYQPAANWVTEVSLITNGIMCLEKILKDVSVIKNK
jgi:hypothetical protein